MSLDPVQAYRLLGLAPGASLDDVKTAYRDLAQVWHPDRFPDNQRLREKALLNLQRINEAYAVLRDYRPDLAALGAVPSVATASAPMPVRHHAPPRWDLRHSLFTGVIAMRHSLKVLQPSATYARKPHRRGLPRPWILIGLGALLLLIFALAALWYKGYLDF
jgi:DnaJ-like protein